MLGAHAPEPPLRLPQAGWGLIKEAARHILRRPVVGIVAAARTPDGRWVLVRRGDTGDWALPGGTLEWGETLRRAIERELAEEAGVRVLALGTLSGVYSRPDRDPRFHAVTIVVEATVTEPEHPPANPIEVREVRCFPDGALPDRLGMGMTEMLRNARRQAPTWE
jgi:8-oxo-dGTP diphosphatase